MCLCAHHPSFVDGRHKYRLRMFVMVVRGYNLLQMVAASACALLICAAPSQAGFQPIGLPDTAYLSSTTRINPAPQVFAQSISDGTLTVSFLVQGNPVARSVASIPAGWPAWAVAPNTESIFDPLDYNPALPMPPFTAYPPNVIKKFGADPQLTLTLDLNGASLTTFGIEVEPEDLNAVSHPITVTFFDDLANDSFAVQLSVFGNADPAEPNSPTGARLFAASTTGDTRITRVTISSDIDFGFANLRYVGASGPVVPEPSSWAMMIGAGVVGLGFYVSRRRRNSGAAA